MKGKHKAKLGKALDGKFPKSGLDVISENESFGIQKTAGDKGKKGSTIF